MVSISLIICKTYKIMLLIYCLKIHNKIKNRIIYSRIIYSRIIYSRIINRIYIIQIIIIIKVINKFNKIKYILIINKHILRTN